MNDYHHGEAFCIMRYSNAEMTSKFGPLTAKEKALAAEPERTEWFWNSRDGVTAFMADGLEHVDWSSDRRALDLETALAVEPRITRVWVDLSPRRAREVAEKNLEVWGRDLNRADRRNLPSVATLVKSYLSEGGEGAPDLVTVEEYRADRGGKPT